MNRFNNIFSYISTLFRSENYLIIAMSLLKWKVQVGQKKSIYISIAHSSVPVFLLALFRTQKLLQVLILYAWKTLFTLTLFFQAWTFSSQITRNQSNRIK